MMRGWVTAIVLLVLVLNGCSPAHTAHPADSAVATGPSEASRFVPPLAERHPSPGPASPEGRGSIVAFEWLDSNNDRVDPSGISLKPGGRKDEHFSLTLQLSPATVVEDLVITGGGMLRWTTRPSNRYWPIAVFQQDRAVNKGQVPRVGTFSGRQTFDLFVESHAAIRRDHLFEIEVAVSASGDTHTLKARCRRHGDKG